MRWPRAVRGGTNSVPSMLALMGDETPIGLVRSVIEGVLLPVGHWLQYPVGVAEVAIGLLIGAGFGLNWAAVSGIALQLFIGLGFFRLDWPLQYPLVILMHVALLPVWMRSGRDERVRLAGRLVLAAVWLYESRLWLLPNTYQPWLLTLVAVALLWGPMVVPAAAAGVFATWFAFTKQTWGSSPWIYYLVAALHLAVIAAAVQHRRARVAPHAPTLRQ